MALGTRQRISDEKFFQNSGDTITLSGNTIVKDIRYSTPPTITGGTQLTTKTYVDSAVAAVTTGSSVVYSGATPASVGVGGIIVGYQLTGKTANQILENLLVPT